jgi:threonine/homoserine/homoserine lactone efflux protein
MDLIAIDFLNLITFVVVAAVLVISPGPNGLLIAKSVASHGRRAGFYNIAGFIVAFYVHGALSIFGLSIILVQSAEAFFIVKMMGAAYLLWVGVQALVSAWRESRPSKSVLSSMQPPVDRSQTQPKSNSTPTGPLRFVLEGFLTNVLNPKVSMFYLAAFPQFITVGESAAQAFTLVSLHALVNFIWFCLITVLLSRLGSVATSQRFKVWLKSVTGAIFIGFAAKLAFLKSVDA